MSLIPKVFSILFLLSTVIVIPGCCWNNCFKKPHLLTIHSNNKPLIEEFIYEENNQNDQIITDSELVFAGKEEDLLIADPDGCEISTEADLIIEDLE